VFFDIAVYLRLPRPLPFLHQLVCFFERPDELPTYKHLSSLYVLMTIPLCCFTHHSCQHSMLFRIQALQRQLLDPLSLLISISEYFDALLASSASQRKGAMSLHYRGAAITAGIAFALAAIVGFKVITASTRPSTEQPEKNANFNPSVDTKDDLSVQAILDEKDSEITPHPPAPLEYEDIGKELLRPSSAVSCTSSTAFSQSDDGTSTPSTTLGDLQSRAGSPDQLIDKRTASSINISLISSNLQSTQLCSAPVAISPLPCPTPHTYEDELANRDELNRVILPLSIFQGDPPMWLRREHMRRQYLEKGRDAKLKGLRKDLDRAIRRWRDRLGEGRSEEEMAKEGIQLKKILGEIQESATKLQPDLQTSQAPPSYTDLSHDAVSITQLTSIFRKIGKEAEEVEIAVKACSGWEWDVDVEWGALTGGAITGQNKIALPRLRRLKLRSFDVPLHSILDQLDAPSLRSLEIDILPFHCMPHRSSEVLRQAGSGSGSDWTCSKRPAKAVDTPTIGHRKRLWQSQGELSALRLSQRCLCGEPWMRFVRNPIDEDEQRPFPALDLLDIRMEGQHGRLPRDVLDSLRGLQGVVGTVAC